MQVTDKNAFFRVGTAHICSSLDIDEAIKHCYRYLGQVIPCDDMFFEQYNKELNAFRIVAQIVKHKINAEAFTLLPSQSKKVILDFWEQEKDVFIVNNPSEVQGFKYLNKIPGFVLNSSFIGLRLCIGKEKIGLFVVGVRETNQYTQAHADLVQTLQIPLSICMANALKHQELARLKDILNDNNRFLQCELNELSGTKIIGANGGLRHVMQMVRQVSRLDSPVLLEGETGVGKGLIANTIHRMSNRNEGPFISVNCGAIPDSLLDSELFGHEKGSFTGAIEQKRGRFERADKGTIFLDEVGELPHQAQLRLLHVLQNKEIERVGGSQTIPVDIRIISATNRKLEDMVEDDKFREDLWYRLNVFPIRIPPLRQRKEDISALIHHFTEKKSIELKKTEQPILAPGTSKRLMSYRWPGNVRELQNIVERALIQHTNGPLRFTDTALLHEENNEETLVISERDKVMPLQNILDVHFRRALVHANGKINGPGGAAELLDIKPNTLRRKLDKLQIPYKKKELSQDRTKLKYRPIKAYRRN